MKEFQWRSIAWVAIVTGIFLTTVAARSAAAQAPTEAPTGPIPAATLTTPTTPTAVPSAEGFIQRWLVLEPIPVMGVTQNAVQATVKKDALPDTQPAVPHTGDKTTVDGKDLTWHALDTKNYNLNLFHFSRSLARPTSDVLFWAVTVVNSPTEMKDVRLAIGSNAASVWWFNGEEVIGIYGDRQTVIDDGVSKRLTLKKGQNIIRAAVVNGGGATDFCARLLDADDKPIKGYTITLAK
ncbi:hypothetical protein Terro_1781 [Terriglobus roseus DSM 18391]|uniref:Acetylxylan esterase n=1 Tax=Terriglobus roseus (strain DSM 18391 / NRRL B-41598 / KBS 63) TaxID=926566 RepID=I3ZFQ9_TERRK|nr:hypothetical protein [Terriglobus roseus]AFL88077.1 hypothetical protein Terro_1781 [Terriglobus roseus DSM 18391]